MTSCSSLAPNAKRLEGKVALIIGGGSGIGKSSARLFFQHGAKVVIAGDEDGKIKFDCCECYGSKNAVTFVICDVTSDSDVHKAVKETISKYGKLDILFTDTGINCKNVDPSILVADDEDFKKVLKVNVFSAFLAAKHAAKAMISIKRGSIIFTSSIASVTAGRVPHAYAASNHALVGLTKNLCVELGAYGIRVNCISPFTEPNLEARLRLLGVDKENVSESATLREAAVEAELDAANAALYLASNDSKYVSGLNLVVDGGYSTTNAALGENLKRRSS